eukprot:g1250.t1
MAAPNLVPADGVGPPQAQIVPMQPLEMDMKQESSTQQSPVAKKFIALSLLCAVGCAMIVNASYKAFFRCPFVITGMPSTVGGSQRLRYGAASVTQTSAVVGDSSGESTIPTCGAKVTTSTMGALGKTTSAEYFDACTGGDPSKSACQYYDENGARVTTTPTGTGPPCNLADPMRVCGCGISKTFALNFKVEIGLELRLGQAEFCITCNCDAATTEYGDDIPSSCGKDGSCMDPQAIAAGEDSDGGGVNTDLPKGLDFKKLGGKGLCYKLDELSSSTSGSSSSTSDGEIPSWVNTLCMVAIVAPAAVLALLFLFYVYKYVKKTTLFDLAHNQSGCCASFCKNIIKNFFYLVAFILAGGIGGVFLFYVPTLLNEQLFKGGFNSQTSTVLGSIGLALNDCTAESGAQGEFIGGCIVLAAWFLSCNCSKCCRF